MLPFTIVINTCFEYAPRTLPVLLESLAMAEVPLESVVVTVGQCVDGQLPTMPEGVVCRMVACDYTGMDLTALICLSERDDVVSTQWVLYLHDTMVVGERFLAQATEAFRQVTGAPSSSDTTPRCVQLLDRNSMNVGFYDAIWLRSLDLSKFKIAADADLEAKREIKAIGCGDKVFEMCPLDNRRYLGTHPRDFTNMGTFTYEEDGSSNTRIIEYYPVLDIFKLKSWNGDVAKVGYYRAADGSMRVNIPVGV